MPLENYKCKNQPPKMEEEEGKGGVKNENYKPLTLPEPNFLRLCNIWKPRILET